jgi:hypothetical protein
MFIDIVLALHLPIFVHHRHIWRWRRVSQNWVWGMDVWLAYFRINTMPESPPSVSTHICLIITLLAGDIQLNPGPTQTYPCGYCEAPVTWDHQRAICCDECSIWCQFLCCRVFMIPIFVHHRHIWRWRRVSQNWVWGMDVWLAYFNTITYILL